MARIARVVVPGCWHHATQRGNHQQRVFFEDSDRKFYLELLQHYCSRQSVRVAGYCLMNNHVHILAIPEAGNGLARALGRAHNDYARWLNLRRRETGHVWQNRFYSCPLDNAHQWEALRYVELNPVRAGLMHRAMEWRRSSAALHVGEPHQTGFRRLQRLEHAVVRRDVGCRTARWRRGFAIAGAHPVSNPNGPSGWR